MVSGEEVQVEQTKGGINKTFGRDYTVRHLFVDLGGVTPMFFLDHYLRMRRRCVVADRGGAGFVICTLISATKPVVQLYLCLRTRVTVVGESF